MDYVRDSPFNQKFPFENDIIDLKAYFSEYSESLISFENCQNYKCKSSEGIGCKAENCKNDAFYKNFLGLSSEELQELKERTSVNHLTCGGEVEPVEHYFYKKFNEIQFKHVPEDESEKKEVQLLSVQKRAEMSDTFKVELPRNFFKYCGYQWNLNNEKQIKSKLDFHTEDLSTVVAIVKVYRPFLSTPNKSPKIKLLQEILILGNQTLAQLRDKIICSIDYVGIQDVSSECYLKEVGLARTAKDEYPSSFIFIENTFYNDTRKPELVDLSKEIREWSSKKSKDSFGCKSMESTQICDLKLRIGHPYVFQHQGNCEHVIVFSDVRFLEMRDAEKSISYPKIHCTGRTYGRHCMMCADSYARWLVRGNERLTHDKTYLCKKCFFSYNYLKGKKIGQFEAFKYVDPIAIL